MIIEISFSVWCVISTTAIKQITRTVRKFPLRDQKLTNKPSPLRIDPLRKIN